MAHNFEAFGMLPGIGDLRETVEGQITWGRWEHASSYILGSVIDGATRDQGHTGNTTILRPGLLMSIYDSDVANKGKKLTVWTDGVQVDGTQLLVGPLLWAQNMQELGTDKDRWFGYVLIGGLVKSKSLIYDPDAGAPGAWVGGASDALVRAALESGTKARGGSGRFILDDMIHQLTA